MGYSYLTILSLAPASPLCEPLTRHLVKKTLPQSYTNHPFPTLPILCPSFSSIACETLTCLVSLFSVFVASLPHKHGSWIVLFPAASSGLAQGLAHSKCQQMSVE